MKFANLLFFQTRRGRHVFSLWASRIFEVSGIKRIFGLNLVMAAVFTGIITPEADNLLSQLYVARTLQNTPIIAETTTKTTLELPLVDFRISQIFTFYHPGIDLVAATGAPIYALEAGDVEFAGTVFFGYGKHVVIKHDHELKSLSAHMSEINVRTGQRVTRGQLIGKVGATGWATGPHLHLEIYYKGVPINPLEILPLKREDIKWDGIVYRKTAPSPTSPVSSPPLSSVQP